MIIKPLTSMQSVLLSVLSLLITGFGQPALVWWVGCIASICGFALFWRVLIDLESPRQRFVVGTAWFAAVQMIQLSWAVSHPFLYIYFVYGLACLWYGAQFGLLCLLITRERLATVFFPVLLAAIWVVMEWTRLFIFSGSSWNPVGLALASTLYGLQPVSLAGIFGLSFWVMLVNGYVLRAWLQGLSMRSGWVAGAIALPYIFGATHLSYHDNKRASEPQKALTALLMQPNFPVEEWLPSYRPQEAFLLALEEWGKVLELLKPFAGQSIDVVVLPENVVPFSAYYPIYRFEAVKALFEQILGTDGAAALPDLATGAAMQVPTARGKVWMVTNGFVVQGIANWLKANVVVGLEDHVPQPDGRMRSYASAFHFTHDNGVQDKYDKRVLVPMGEYIPFAIIQPLAERYGIHDSFTPGDSAKVMYCRQVPMGVSICYEETYGHLMRENRLLGAEVLLNLTNDGWYPHSWLPHQHFEHSRPRSVELGIPLLRSCNTGYTCAIDASGQLIGAIDDTTASQVLKVDVPVYHYSTLYTQTGDTLIIGSSFFIIGLGALFGRRWR